MRLHLWAEFQNYKLCYTNVFCIPLTSLEVLALGHLARLTMSFRLLTYWRLTIDHLQHSGMALQTSMVSLIPINTCSKVIPTDNFTNLHKPFNVCKQLMWLNCKWFKGNIPNRGHSLSQDIRANILQSSSIEPHLRQLHKPQGVRRMI